MKAFRDALRRLLSETTAELDSLCSGQDSGLTIPNLVPDDWRNNHRGYSWVYNIYKTDFNFPREALVKHIFDNPSNKILEINASGNLNLNQAAMKRFMEHCKSINKKLALLCYFLPGLSQRVAQFIEHKLANSTRPRTLFRNLNDLWLVIRRSKSETLVGKETFSPLKCPPVLARLLEKYLLVVRPLEEKLAYHIGGKDALHLYREYLWVQNCKEITSKAMCTSIRDFLRNYCSAENMGVRDFRQICVEIGRVYIGSEVNMDLNRTNVLDAQMCHSSSIANNEYAVEFNHLPGMSSQMLLRYGKISEQWWEVIGVVPDTPPILPLAQRIQAERDSSANMYKTIIEQLKEQCATNARMSSEISGLKQMITDLVNFWP